MVEFQEALPDVSKKKKIINFAQNKPYDTNRRIIKKPYSKNHYWNGYRFIAGSIFGTEQLSRDRKIVFLGDQCPIGIMVCDLFHVGHIDCDSGIMANQQTFKKKN